MEQTFPLIQSYVELRPSIEVFASKLRQLIEELLISGGVKIHSITARAKSVDSLAKKLASSAGRYETLDDVTDLAGVRIITYFADDVDRAGRIVAGEFAVVERHSIDKRAVLKPDQFGYLSLHYVVKLDERRALLAENRRFSGLVAEVQVRSILQHAWAEIEHDLGYRREEGVPSVSRREFSRVAGLLETADVAFMGLRDKLSSYETALPRRIEVEPSTVPVDKASVKIFLDTSAAIATLNAYVLTIAGGATVASDDEAIERHVRLLLFFGITTIDRLDSEIRKESEAIQRLMHAFIRAGKPLHASILPLIFLQYIYLARSADASTLRDFFHAAGVSWPPDFLDRLRAAYASAGL